MDLFTKTEVMLLKLFSFIVVFAPLLVFGKEVTVIEPVTTWNLYATPIIVGVSTAVIILYISRMFSRRDKKDEQIEILKKEAKILEERNIQQWRNTYTDTQCRIKETVERIELALDKKVEKDDCVREHSDTWDAINKLRKV